MIANKNSFNIKRVARFFHKMHLQLFDGFWVYKKVGILTWNVPEYGAIKSSPTKRETRKGEDRV